ncbi:hypothetical protein SMD44_01938 [Streptomyces alboflavus]|uniref:Uncharacterized protein n=1 Tax=Streptomyces alboflavus TaxID=67267 RepID=A0A1Z1W7X9_9ACTN|nr:hypothetical protein SMD44_01938 [Streptomyces alboflavus]
MLLPGRAVHGALGRRQDKAPWDTAPQDQAPTAHR